MTQPPPAARFDDAPVAVEPGRLQVGDALQLLARAGLLPGEHLAAGSSDWLQHVVDALCTLSSRDPLTGLVNRRQFESALDREIDRVARNGESALLLVIDIDHFKRVNDTHGHAAGDRVIQAIGKALQESVRPMDTVARLGGEEFGVVLSNCMPAFGQAVAERVRRRVEDTTVAIDGGLHLQVTVSVGGAFAPQWVRASRPLWFERADRQLYRAKSEGRNRACLEFPAQSDVSAEERDLLLGVYTEADTGLGDLP